MNEYWMLAYMFFIISVSMFTISTLYSGESKKMLTFSSAGSFIAGLIFMLAQLL